MAHDLSKDSKSACGESCQRWGIPSVNRQSYLTMLGRDGPQMDSAGVLASITRWWPVGRGQTCDWQIAAITRSNHEFDETNCCCRVTCCSLRVERHFVRESISTFSSSSRKAQATRQRAIIAGNEAQPIQISPILSARTSQRYLGELVLGSGTNDIVIDSGFDQDSVFEFICVCEVDDFALTISNISEIELLCREWWFMRNGFGRRF
jgi:hypothetical protein